MLLINKVVGNKYDGCGDLMNSNSRNNNNNNNNVKRGSASLIFNNKVFVYEYASIVGKKEGKGPLGQYFDFIEEDELFGEKSWEKAESKMQYRMLNILLDKAGVDKKDIRYMCGGDLLGQLIATTFGVKDLDIPIFGLYGACSTMGESLGIASMMINAGYADKVIAFTSSHYAGAEKNYRFPLDYGNQKPLAATTTVTGAGGVILSCVPKDKEKERRNIVVKGITTGKIVDYGVKDSMNMGACMAPAAADVIYNNFKDLGVGVHYYDQIITGDLGNVGKDILIDIMNKKGYDIENKYMDCGIEIYYSDIQGTLSGGSGCGCSATTLCGYIFDKMRKGEWNRILFVPTGALLSPVSFNEGESVPGIAHGVVFENVKE